MIQNPTNPSSIYLFGGKTDDGKISSVVEINFDKSSVQHMKPMKEARCYAKGYLHDKAVHLIGGGTESIEEYDISTNISTINR